MSENASPNPLWVSSSYSGNGGGNCIQWQPLSGQNGQVPVRDSKDTTLAGFAVAAPAWSVFVDYAKSVRV